MDLSYYLFFFIFGTAVGSFLNVLIDRLPRGESFFNSRSYCENCKNKLSYLDLIPVVSFLFLRGKCRYCKAKISKRLIFVELLTGLTFVYLSFLFQTNVLSFPALIFYLFFSCSLIVIFFSDLISGIIPDEINTALLVAAFIYKLVYEKNLLIPSLFSGLVILIFFLGLYLITRGKGMGMGDVKLSFVLGFVLGFPESLMAAYLAFLTGGLVSTILIIWGKKKFRGDTIPFGPFLIVGTILSFFLTERILNLLGFS